MARCVDRLPSESPSVSFSSLKSAEPVAMSVDMIPRRAFWWMISSMASRAGASTTRLPAVSSRYRDAVDNVETSEGQGRHGQAYNFRRQRANARNDLSCVLQHKG